MHGDLPLLSGKHMGKIMKFRLQKSKHSLPRRTGSFIAARDLEELILIVNISLNFIILLRQDQN